MCYFGDDAHENSTFITAAYRGFFLNARAMKGIDSLALVDHFPLTEAFYGIRAEGTRGPISFSPQPAEFHVVTPSYSEIGGIRLTDGRWLDEFDGASSRPVAVINTAMATR